MLKTGQNKYTLVSTQQTHFFVLLLVHAKGKTDSTSHSVLINEKR